MNVWTWVHFTSFVIYTLAVFYTIIKNPFAVINWVLAMLFFYFALWSGCSSILNNTTMNYINADVVMKLQSVAWASFMSYFFIFILLLTNNKKFIKGPLIILFTIIIPGMFIYQNLNGNMLICCKQVFYGMAGSWKNSIWPMIYLIYYTILFIISIIILFKYRNTTRIKSEKKMIDIMLSSAITVFVIGTLFSVFMNYMHIYNPIDANVVFLIFVFGFIYSAEKYETLTLSSTRNADRIMELINEGIALIDKDGFVTTTNRAALEIFGYLDPGNTSGAYVFIEKQIKSAGVPADGIEVTNVELVFVDAQNVEKIALFSSRTLLKGKEHSGRVCTIRDITTKKKTELDLSDTVKELKRSNEDLESFAYVASHDLKEPLRMISSYVQLIKKKFTDKIGADGNDYINFVSDGAKRMSDLIEGLLDYSRIKKDKRECSTMDTGEQFSHVIDLMKFKIEDKKGVINIKDKLPIISGDKMQIERLFQNLISNAVKFASSEPLVVSINYEIANENYKFIIKDNGIGVEKEYQEKIFQIFQRLHTKAEYDGTGVGLAICRKIVENHGGTIWVESEGLGKGCSFCFTIPRKQKII